MACSNFLDLLCVISIRPIYQKICDIKFRGFYTPYFPVPYFSMGNFGILNKSVVIKDYPITIVFFCLELSWAFVQGNAQGGLALSNFSVFFNYCLFTVTFYSNYRFAVIFCLISKYLKFYGQLMTYLQL